MFDLTVRIYFENLQAFSKGTICFYMTKADWHKSSGEIGLSRLFSLNWDYRVLLKGLTCLAFKICYIQFFTGGCVSEGTEEKMTIFFHTKQYNFLISDSFSFLCIFVCNFHILFLGVLCAGPKKNQFIVNFFDASTQ